MTPQASDRSYRVREFATLAGVTVRALHHYDRVGLLKPRRTHSAYRVYRDSDLLRLQQILVLKFLGLSLSGIASALKSDARLEAALMEAPARDWTDLASFVRDISPPGPREGSTERQELDEALRLLGERRKALDVTLEEYELNRDVRVALSDGETPDTPAGRALVARWRQSIERFIGGDSNLRAAFALVMARRRPPDDPAYRAFYDRALQT